MASTSSSNTTLESPQSTYFNLIPPNNDFNYDSEDMELDEEDGYTTNEESIMNASNNVMPRSIYEYLKPANLEGATMLVEMDDMTQQETLGTVKIFLVKIDKFEFPCDFVVTDMSENFKEMIILERPFLETIHALIDVFQEEISLGFGKDRIKFDDTRNYDTIDPQNESAGQTNPLLDKGGLINRWHVCKPVRVFYDDESGEDCGIWPTCDPDSSFCYGYKEVFGKCEQGMLRQWVCFHDHERRTVKGSCMGFADFLQVRYENQRIDDTTREQRYYKWVAQNYEFDNNRTPSTTTVSDKGPYKTNYPTPISLDKWDTRFHITYTGSTSNQNIPNNNPTPFSLEHSELGEKADISDSPKLRPFTPNPYDYSFDEWLKVNIGHTNIYESDWEIVFNEWILDSFDVEEEYAKEIGNPYSRRFDEYKRMFDNEVEILSNEYTLRIGKKGYVLDDVWEKCEQYPRKIIDSWHDIGFKEEELWRSRDEKTDYEPPFVDIKTFKVKKYSFKRDKVLYV
uniref:Reverse transcriptase domain-containing protein n=1 Tax=Tanacetum cinerariifolium TaxID=118510 RepID=A0A6L2NI75_TANCI|nr:hypothetical protein [Tanacetum cinerariifolium]